MIKILQNLTFFCLLFTFLSCTSSNEITITKVEGSPSYENAKLSMADVVKGDNEYSFSFEHLSNLLHVVYRQREQPYLHQDHL